MRGRGKKKRKGRLGKEEKRWIHASRYRRTKRRTRKKVRSEDFQRNFKTRRWGGGWVGEGREEAIELCGEAARCASRSNRSTVTDIPDSLSKLEKMLMSC